MDIIFKNGDLESILVSRISVYEHFEATTAAHIMRRITQIRAANDLSVFAPPGKPPMRCKVIRLKPSVRFSISLGNKNVFVFEDCEDSTIAHETDWPKIKKIRILEIGKVA